LGVANRKVVKADAKAFIATQSTAPAENRWLQAKR
jgi:hypothetical protein